MLAFVPLVAPAIGVGMGALLLLILALTYIVVFRPIEEWVGDRSGGLFKRLVYWGVNKVIGKVKEFAQHHSRILINSYLARAKPLIALIGNVQELALRVAGSFGDNAEATYRALRTLRTVTIPRLIEAAVAPVRVQAAQARQLALQTAQRLDQAQAQLGAALRAEAFGTWSTLAAQLVGMARALGDLHRKVWNDLAPKVQTLQKRVFETIEVQIRSLTRQAFVVLPERLERVELQVGRIVSALGGLTAEAREQLEKLLNPALFALAVLTAMQALAPNLFCRNTTAATQALCRQDENAIRDLLAGALVFAIALNPREVAAAGQSLTGILGGVIRETVAH